MNRAPAVAAKFRISDPDQVVLQVYRSLKGDSSHLKLKHSKSSQQLQQSPESLSLNVNVELGRQLQVGLGFEQLTSGIRSKVREDGCRVGRKRCSFSMDRMCASQSYIWYSRTRTKMRSGKSRAFNRSVFTWGSLDEKYVVEEMCVIS